MTAYNTNDSIPIREKINDFEQQQFTQQQQQELISLPLNYLPNVSLLPPNNLPFNTITTQQQNFQQQQTTLVVQKQQQFDEKKKKTKKTNNIKKSDSPLLINNIINNPTCSNDEVITVNIQRGKGD